MTKIASDPNTKARKIGRVDFFISNRKSTFSKITHYDIPSSYEQLPLNFVLLSTGNISAKPAA